MDRHNSHWLIKEQFGNQEETAGQRTGFVTKSLFSIVAMKSLIAHNSGHLARVNLWFAVQSRSVQSAVELCVVDCVVYCVFVLTNGPVLCKKRGEITPSPCRPRC